MCSGAIIGIADGPVDGTCRTEQCVEEVVSNFKNAVGGKRHEASLTLAGVPRRVIQLDGALLGEKRIRVIIAVLDRSEGRRVLICVGTPEHEARCHAAFEAMSTLVWRAGVPSFFKSKQH